MQYLQPSSNLLDVHWMPPVSTATASYYQPQQQVHPAGATPFYAAATLPAASVHQPSVVPTYMPTPDATPALTSTMLPAPVLMTPNPAARGTPALMPGVLNSTFTPTAAIFTGTSTTAVTRRTKKANRHEEEHESSEEESEDEEDEEEPPRCIPKSSFGEKKEPRRRKSSSQVYSSYESIPTPGDITCCGQCFIACYCSSIRCPRRTQIICTCADSSNTLPKRREHDTSKSKRRSLYYHHSESIYDFNTRPAPQSIQVPMLHEQPKHRSLSLRKFWKVPKPMTYDQWAAIASAHLPVNPTQAIHTHPVGVEVHPMLSKYCTNLVFDVLEPAEYIVDAQGHGPMSLLTHPATSPPLLKLEIFTFFRNVPLILENSGGVTFRQVLEGILGLMTETVRGREAREWSDERREVIYRWFWHNRQRNRHMDHCLLAGDTLGEFTKFEGLLPVPQACALDSRALTLPKAALWLFLGANSTIPYLRPITDFPV
ncbi:hypothetical protein FRC20_009967 [Serendipita sp. 405]|nr:hypothetical protein FRC15_011988 [Serendipita sp. 397]KAG8801514.1 hypothetical protein FRC16_000298 [Serendipita sp. 398]KAG8871937.1 hypothetical protein FRC20_009967 [Serendipita sp. 405]